MKHVKNRRYDTWGIYHPFIELLQRHNISLTGVFVAAIARKSDESGVLAAEQASKHFGTVARQVTAIRDLLNEHPVSTWNDPDVRARLGIIEVRELDVMPWRTVRGSAGTSVIGDLLVLNGVAYLVVARSGFKSALTDEMEPRNAYSELVIQLIKSMRSANRDDEIAMRLAGDRSRKGRLLQEMVRMNAHRDALRIEVWYGAEKVEGGYAGLLELITDAGSQKGRDTLVTNALQGRLSAVHSARLSMAEANLPPSLEHRNDPNSDAVDPRIREAQQLVCFHAHHLQPAIAAYLSALGSGASDRELAVILRTHRVPTTRGRGSGRRSTTFDQITMAEAERRARRWLTYDDHPIVVGDSREAKISQRKLQLLREGSFLWQWSNPSPHADEYDAGGVDGIVPVVERETSYESGRLEDQPVFMGFPAQRLVTTETRWVDPTGAPSDPTAHNAKGVEVRVVTDELVLDEKGSAVDWVAWGIDAQAYDAAVEQLAARHDGTHSTKHTNGRTTFDRLVGSVECVTDGKRLELSPAGSSAKDQGRIYRQRRIVEHPDGPDSTNSWSEIRDSLARASRAEGGIANADDYWHATIQERLLVLALAGAMANAVGDHLDGDLALMAPDRHEHEARTARVRADLLTQQDALSQARTLANDDKASARRLMGREVDNDDLYAEAKADYDDAAARLSLLDEEEASLQRRLDQVDAELPRGSEAVEPAPVDAFASVATLIALIEASAEADYTTGRGPGELPADLARAIAATLSDWQVHVPTDDEPRVRLECIWTVTLADGSRHALPLTMEVESTKNGDGDGNRRLATATLAEGHGLQAIVDASPRPTTAPSVWRTTVRPLLAAWGVGPRLRGAVIDTPLSIVRTTLAVELGGADRPEGPWDECLAAHLVSAYTADRSWNDAAVPTETSEMAAILAAAAQHPELGVTQLALEATGSGRAALAKKMITPPTTKKATQPSMLQWRDDGVVGPYRCPHDDCPAAGHGYATVLVYLPETTPTTDGGPGAVLCPACRRIPDPNYATIRFTAEYVSTATLSGLQYRGKDTSIADGRTHQVRVSVPEVPAATHRTLAAVARDLGIPRHRAQALVDQVNVAFDEHRTAPAGAVRKRFDLRAARDAHGLSPE